MLQFRTLCWPTTLTSPAGPVMAWMFPTFLEQRKHPLSWLLDVELCFSGLRPFWPDVLPHTRIHSEILKNKRYGPDWNYTKQVCPYLPNETLVVADMQVGSSNKQHLPLNVHIYIHTAPVATEKQ